MLRAVIKKELLSHLVSFRFMASTFIMLILAALAASVGTRDFLLRQDHHQARLDTHAESLDGVHVFSQLHPSIARAPEPLSVLHRGFDARLGAEVQLNVFQVPTAATDHFGDDGASHPLRDFDLTTIVRVVLGLLALLLTFDAVVGERETGTLRLVLANAVSRPILIAGKYLGACIALLAPLLAGSALSLWILLERGGVVLDALRWQRLAGLFLAYALYLSVMVLLGLLLSATARTTAGALVYSLLSWLAIVFLIPQSAVAVAVAVEARPVSPATDRAITELLSQRDRELSQLYEQAGSGSLTKLDRAPVFDEVSPRGVIYRFGSADFYDSKVNYHARETAIGMDYAERIFEHERRIGARGQRIESLARILASASPAFLMERIAGSYAGTSVEDHDCFLEDSRELRRRFIEYLERRGAFTSWRWFTDDRPDTLKPWPRFLGVTPETVDDKEVDALTRRFQEDDVQKRVLEAKEALNADPRRRLSLRDLPDVRRDGPDFQQACRRVAAETSLLSLLNAVLAGAVWWLLAGYSPR